MENSGKRTGVEQCLCAFPHPPLPGAHPLVRQFFRLPLASKRPTKYGGTTYRRLNSSTSCLTRRVSVPSSIVFPTSANWIPTSCQTTLITSTVRKSLVFALLALFNHTNKTDHINQNRMISGKEIVPIIFVSFYHFYFVR